MIYNKKYNRWVSKDGLVYRYSKTQDKLILCKQSKASAGYRRVRVSGNKLDIVFVHRLVWETFNGEIPEGMEIDHINTIKTDNRLENLRCVTHKENCNNPITKIKRQKSLAELGKKN